MAKKKTSDEKTDEAQNKVTVPASALASTKDQKRIRTERFKSVYVNNVAVRFSTLDVSLFLGEIIGEEDDEPVIEETLKLNMSREMVKLMVILLTQHLRMWEKEYGEIKIPDVIKAASESDDDPATSDDLALAT